MTVRHWLWWRIQCAVAAVLEAGALYFDAINDRQHKPSTRRDDDHDPDTCAICKTNRHGD